MLGFHKLGDGSYPVLRSRDENRTGQQIEGPKVNLFLLFSFELSSPLVFHVHTFFERLNSTAFFKKNI